MPPDPMGQTGAPHLTFRQIRGQQFRGQYTYLPLDIPDDVVKPLRLMLRRHAGCPAQSAPAAADCVRVRQPDPFTSSNRANCSEIAAIRNMSLPAERPGANARSTSGSDEAFLRAGEPNSDSPARPNAPQAAVANASTGSAITLSAPPSILRRSAPQSGRWRSAK